MRKILLGLSFALLLAVTAPGRARAVPFDFIVADSIDLVLCTNGCGLTLASSDFGLIVNKNAFDITAANLNAVQFTVVSSTPDLQLLPFINDAAAAVKAPIHPTEVVGTTSTVPNNLMLLGPILPGEFYRNSNAQFI